jgi:hypothetical protein
MQLTGNYPGTRRATGKRNCGLMKKLIAGLAGLAIAGISITGYGSQAASVTAGHAGVTAGLDSHDWAGYVDIFGGTHASADWTVPSVSGANGNSASWVGLDGDGSATVEQTGTESAISGGHQLDYAWVELYPAPQVILPGTVHPGDKMAASVTTTGNGYYAISITDTTRGWHYAKTTADFSASNASAEVVTEAPSSAATGNVLPLADFGAQTFTHVSITGDASQITMVARNGAVKASVSGSQRGFTVDFRSAGLAP